MSIHHAVGSERGAVANDDVIVRARYVNNRADSTTFGASILIMPIYSNKMDRRNDICS